MNSNYLLTSCKSKDIITELTIFKHCSQTALALAWSDMALEIVLDLACIPKNLHFALVSPGLIIVSIIAYVGWPCAGHLM